ncbi:AIG2-like family protein [Sporomusa ovata DSM 2662]|uniref:Gamma-glutamylcyclotransferase AIG2-like domain-containing protein n=1 Tax=Sporomusa ovata TaxID=2378 RepID=A0A0U1L7W8_9FIRM|nr:gamma-glutamylcyclotransferase [Sporomusa ovata]EQB24627.1 AIG2 family protein [Sporomusa ovata DSM 2662]CQR74974.1 hypothetical protein SpAn4DRAFT_4338 [Sporomusa ovata]
METKIYAAYGSNLNLKQMKKRCPKAKVIGKGELHDYKLTFRGKQAGVANVERSNNDSVPIVLWEITKDCERDLDRYEGYPKLYEKELVTVQTDAGQKIAMIYVMAKQYEDMPSLPSEYYFEIIRQGYLDNRIETASLDEALANTKTELL